MSLIASTSRVLERWFDIVINADGSQKTVPAALVHTNSRLGRQIVATPTDTVIFHGATHPVVGDGADLEAHAAAGAKAFGEERAELRCAAVGVMRAD